MSKWKIAGLVLLGLFVIGLVSNNSKAKSNDPAHITITSTPSTAAPSTTTTTVDTQAAVCVSQANNLTRRITALQASANPTTLAEVHVFLYQAQSLVTDMRSFAASCGHYDPAAAAQINASADSMQQLINQANSMLGAYAS